MKIIKEVERLNWSNIKKNSYLPNILNDVCRLRFDYKFYQFLIMNNCEHAASDDKNQDLFSTHFINPEL
jgi:hypothetical protein